MLQLNGKRRGYRLSVYGSPIESTTYKLAKCLKERFGTIKGITIEDILLTLIMFQYLKRLMHF